MAVRETLLLDLSQALGQIDDLERELDGLFQPIVIPVDIETDAALGQLQRDINAVDNDDINIDVDSGELSQAEREIAELQDELSDAVDDAQKFTREMDRAGREAQTLGSKGKRAFAGLSSSLGGLAVAAAGFVGLREITRFFGESIDAASDLEESTSKAQVVFGSFFDDIEDFASTAPQALGLANSAALEFTGTFGNLFVALGLSQEAAADLAPDIVQLGADLASFNNLEVTDALDKLRAGLVGEAEPLRALGVNLTAATTNAKALELGLASSTGEVSEAAKVQARYALILEQTTTAQGDFARTADGIANRQRTLSASFTELQQSIGVAALPAFEALLDAGPALLDAIKALTPIVADFAETISEIDFTAAIGGLRTFGNTASGVISFLQGDLVSFDISKAINDFNTSVEAGQAPAVAFEAVLGRLQDIDLGFDISAETEAAGVRRLVEELQGFADLDQDSLLSIFKDIVLLGEASGFSEVEIAAIKEALLDLINIGERGDGLDFARRGGRNIDALGEAAEAAAPQLAGFGGAFEFVNRIAAQSVDFEKLRSNFESLPTALSAAGDALRDEEGEIETDFSTFLANLQDELDENLEFNAGIDALRDRGLDNLADVIVENLQPGPEANQLIADALASPLESAEAEAAITAAALANAQLYSSEFGADVKTFVDAFDPIEFPIQIVPDLSTFQIDLPEFGPISIPVGFGDPQGSPTGPAPTGGGSGNTFEFNYNGVVPSSTQEAQTAQRVNAIVSNFS